MKSLFFSLFLACSATITVAQEPQPLVRARIEPSTNIVVGQRVRLVVEVLVPNYFTGSLDFPDFELKNAIVAQPAETPQNFSERIGGASYAGIRRTYFLYPEQAGEFRLPPVPFDVSFADAPPHSEHAHLSLPTLAFHAAVPIAAQALGYFLPTTKLDMRQKWTPSLKNLRAGDTFDRTVTITAENLQGMLIPPLPFAAPDGIRIYPEQPQVEDQKTDRGEFVGGRRIQSAKYLIQKPGEYTLPALELTWWDLNAGRLRTERLPGVQIVAAADSGYVPEMPPANMAPAVRQPSVGSLWKKYKARIRITGVWIIVTLLLLWIARRTIPKFSGWFRRRREQYKNSEAAQFRKLLSSCYRNEAVASYQGLLHWLALASPGTDLQKFLDLADDVMFTTQVSELGSELYSTAKSGHWSGKTLAVSLKKLRKLSVLRSKPNRHLPDLNPLNDNMRSIHES